jgi:NADH-quinone oxidoreductase subunit K
MISEIAMENVFILAGLLFAIGLTGLLLRRDIIFMLLSLEIMLNAAGLAFIAAGAKWAEADGQVMFIFILAAAGAEVAVALAIVLLFYGVHKRLNTDDAKDMRG